MKGQNSPEVANQGWPCMILWSPKLFTCKEFLKKWPHWGSCECTGWRTPNTVLYMEEKPRGENRFWWVSTSWPISDRKPRSVCSPVSRKEGVGDCKHLLQGRGRWRFLLLLVISEQENWGFLCSSDVQRAPRNQQQAGLYLDDRSPCIPHIRLYSTIDSSVSAWCCVTIYDSSACVILTSGWQKCDPVHIFFSCVGSGMSACSKMDFIYDGTFTWFDPKDVLTSKLEYRFHKSRRGNLCHPRNKLCSLFFVFGPQFTLF